MKTPKLIKIIKDCIVCKKRFFVHPYRTKTALFCSPPCRSAWLKKFWAKKRTERLHDLNFNKLCIRCRKKFFVGDPYRIKIAKYCSHKCANLHRNGKRIQGGYIWFYKPNHPSADKRGYIFEHRLKMEQKLKCPLRKDEVVHHKNGIKTDNRLSNLVVMNKFEHKKLHYPKGTKFGANLR